MILVLLFAGAGKMGTLVRVTLRTANNGLSCRFKAPRLVKSLSTDAAFDHHGGVDESNSNSFEPSDEFEQRVFGGISGSDSSNDFFFQQLDRLEKVRSKLSSRQDERIGSGMLDGLDEGFNTLSDGMDGKLKKAATYFEFDQEEVAKDDYSFRPDMNFINGSTYDIKDLDLRKPRVTKPPKWKEFEVTTEEALRKADFRNVRFLANFITEAGIIVKRSKTGISAKAQRKIAREIKTARAFGLMPFTTMGTKSFVFGKTMEDLEEDYQYETFDGRVVVDDPKGI